LSEQIVNFLFWPWFSAYRHSLVEKLAHFSVPQSIFLVAIILAFLVFARIKIINRNLEREGAWPKFLQISTKALLGLIFVGLLGTIFNLSAMVCNGSKMPVAVQSRIEFDIYSRYGLDSRHVLAGADTPLFILVDYVRVNLSHSLGFLFPSSSYASPGDLMKAACIIFSWWLAIALAAWLPLFAAREILAKPPPSKS
jgi:hypothetical protein